jgi:multicomponent Na+:H+ antiporter subunit G
MSAALRDVVAAALFLGGGFFCLVAGLGILRLGDVYMRMHAATKAGTLGLALVCLGAMARAATWAQLLEPLFVLIFMIATAPVGAHLIGRAAFRSRTPCDPRTREDAGTSAFRE